MSNPTGERPAGARESTEVTCSKCGAKTTVPFVPTPGRPVYCRGCFDKVNAGGAGGGGRPGGPGGARMRVRGGGNQTQARKRMMKQGRKQHFMYDAKEVLSEGKMPENEIRPFLETLFSRGARVGTPAAREFLSEKKDEGALSDNEFTYLDRLVERYSMWR